MQSSYRILFTSFSAPTSLIDHTLYHGRINFAKLAVQQFVVSAFCIAQQANLIYNIYFCTFTKAFIIAANLSHAHSHSYSLYFVLSTSKRYACCFVLIFSVQTRTIYSLFFLLSRTLTLLTVCTFYLLLLKVMLGASFWFTAYTLALITVYTFIFNV